MGSQTVCRWVGGFFFTALPTLPPLLSCGFPFSQVLFGLAVPVPSKDMLIVPSLIELNDTASLTDEVFELECIVTVKPRSEHEASLLTSEEAALRTGHLPHGLFNQLCVAAVGWSLQSAPTAQPQLGSRHATVYFGRRRVLLVRLPNEQALRLRLRKADDSAAVRLRLRLLLDEVLRRRFPTLCAHFHLHVPGAEAQLVDVHELEELSGSTAIHVPSLDESVDAAQLRRQLAVWLPPEEPTLGPTGEFHAFVSYRQTEDGEFSVDSRFADMVCDCLTARDKLVFLDKRWPSLVSGRALDTAFLLSLVNSRLIVPLISWSALRYVTALTADTQDVDYLLLEWTMAVLLQELGVRVLPVFIGTDRAADLFASRPPRARADGNGDALDEVTGKPVPDTRSVFDRLPDVVVGAVAQRLEDFFGKFAGVPIPSAVRTLTVRQVVLKLKGFGGVQLWSVETSHGGKRTAIGKLAHHWGKEEAVAELVEKALEKAPKCSVRFAEPVTTGLDPQNLEQKMLARVLSNQDQLLSDQKRHSARLDGLVAGQ